LAIGICRNSLTTLILPEMSLDDTATTRQHENQPQNGIVQVKTAQFTI
jgi:hypothetical protein